MKAFRETVARESVALGRAIRSDRDVVARMADMAALDHERMFALGLDAKGRVVAELLLAVGGLTSCSVEPRAIFRRLLMADRPIVSFILVHNHPSGDPKPSVDDIRLTQAVRDGGELLGLPLHDHVIVAAEGHYSFAAEGLLR